MELTGGWRRLINEKLRGFYTLLRKYSGGKVNEDKIDRHVDLTGRRKCMQDFIWET